MAGAVKKNFESPDESRTPDKTQVAVVDLGSVKAARLTMQPGWRWSDCIKPIVGTDSCQVHHEGMNHKMEELDIPSIPEFIEMIADTGAGLYACKASVDLFGLEKNTSSRKSKTSSPSASSTSRPPEARSSSPDWARWTTRSSPTLRAKCPLVSGMQWTP